LKDVGGRDGMPSAIGGHMASQQSFRDLEVWQEGMTLVE
jgi:hypothetical protein